MMITASYMEKRESGPLRNNNLYSQAEGGYKMLQPNGQKIGDLTTERIVRSRSSTPCLWEYGGGSTNTGSAQIITGRRFEPRPAIFIPENGHLSNGNHALIPIDIGCYIIRAERGEDLTVSIYKIISIEDEKGQAEKTHSDGRNATLKLINLYNMGEWERSIDEAELASEIAINKVNCYHCRSPYFIQRKSQDPKIVDLIVVSNHHPKTWSEKQRERWKEILFIPFPNVPPESDMEVVRKIAAWLTEKIMANCSNNDTRLCIQGEFSLTAAILNGLIEKGFDMDLLTFPTSEREVVIKGGGIKRVIFHFVRWR